MSSETASQSRIIGFEMFVSRSLHRDMFAGVTDPHVRQRRVRLLLLTDGIGSRVLDDLQGWETWACRFERIYGEPLMPERSMSFQNFMPGGPAQLDEYAKYLQPQGELL